jgi:hypothetical protein
MRFVVGVVVALLAVAPAAAADPIPYPAAHFPHELALAGSRLLWTDADGRLRAQDPGGPPRVLFAPRQDGGGMFPEVKQIAADAARIAFVAGTGFDDEGEMWESLRAGPRDGPFALVTGSETASLEPPPIGPIAVYDGGLLEMGVVDGASQVTVRPNGGAPRALFRSTTAANVVAAGGVAAVVSQSDFARQKPPPPAQLDVLDIATGARLYGLALRGAPEAAVAPDGTVLVLQGDALAWASPAAPALHPIARSVDVLGGLGNGTAVFAVRMADGFDVIRGADLTTGAVRDISPMLTRIDRTRPDLAWDGAHLAYDNGSCVLAGDLPAAAPATMPVAAGCPRPPLTTEVKTLQRRHAVRIGARCPGGTADRCTGTARITARIAGRTRLLAKARIALTGGRATELTLTAKRSLLRRVRPRDGGRRARLEIRMTAGRVDERNQLVIFAP